MPAKNEPRRPGKRTAQTNEPSETERQPAPPHEPPSPALIQRAMAQPNSLGPDDVLGLQRVIGNRDLGDLMAPSTPDVAVQRKLGHKLKKGSQVFWDNRGLITKWGIIDAVVPKAGIKNKALSLIGLGEVRYYHVNMTDEKAEEQQVDPDDREWYKPVDWDVEKGTPKGSAEEKESKEVESDDADLLSSVSKVEQLKGFAAAGKILYTSASGYFGKTAYLEGNVDSALNYLDKAAGWVDKVTHLFPPAKIITQPVKQATGALKLGLKGERLRELLKSSDAIPLTTGALDEVIEQLEEIPRDYKSDEVDRIGQLEDALKTLQRHLDAMLEEAAVGGSDE